MKYFKLQHHINAFLNTYTNPPAQLKIYCNSIDYFLNFICITIKTLQVSHPSNIFTIGILSMKTNNPQAIAKQLPLLEISNSTTELQAIAAMQIFDQFEGQLVGVTHFSGLTPWERHRQDELLFVLEGTVELTLHGEDGLQTSISSAGQVCVVPKQVWHRQRGLPTVKLMFITGETDISRDDDPTQFKP